MSRRDCRGRVASANYRVWERAVAFYSNLLVNADRLLAEERDPAMLLAGCKIRDELQEAHRLALHKLRALGGAQA